MADTDLTLSDAGLLMLEALKERVVNIEVVLDDWKVTGRAKRHKMSHNIKICIRLDNGKRYVVSETRETCYENGEYTIQLPEDAMGFSINGGRA